MPAREPNEIYFEVRDVAVKNGIGTILAWAGPTGHAPDGWIICDGRELDPKEKQYFPLFAVIGITYGAGTDGTKFQLPNLKQRTILGADDKDHKYSVGAKVGSTSQHVPIRLNLPSETFYSPSIPNLENPNRYNHVPSTTVGTDVDVDTTPPAVVMNYIIKFK